MKFLKKTIWFVLAVLLVFFGVRAIKEKRSEEANIPPAKTYAVVVRTVTPEEGNVTLTLPFVAEVRNDNDTVVATRISARIEMMHKSGARVREGEPVVRLDKRDLDAKVGAVRAQIAAARAELAAAESAMSALKAKHARTEKLLKVRGVSQEEYDGEVAQIAETEAKIAAAKTKAETLRANLKELTQQLDYAVLRAPVSGVIAETYANPGDMAMPGKPLMRIRAKAGDYLLVRLPRSLMVSALRFEGETYRLYPLEGTENGLSLYRTALLNRGLSTGSFVDADVVTFRGKGLKVPVDAVLSRHEGDAVLTVENRRAGLVPVRVVASGAEGLVIEAEGVAGRPIAVAKPDVLLRLATGVPVRVRESGTGNRETE